jgi:tRNA threonylcarbamoyladenosine biosynthesis protein TsaB
MLILGLDTATLTLSAALVERSSQGDRLLERVIEPPPTPHSSLLPALIDRLLTNAGASPKDLGAIVVGLGPGSFTGLRISLATAKGISYAAHVPLMGASSLAAMALAAASEVEEGTWLVPCLDARKGEVYCGLFAKRDRTIAALEPESALSPESLVARLPTNACLFGLGREAYPALDGRPPPATSVRTPDAFALVRLATDPAPYSAQGTFALEPHYVRPSDHEWTLKAKRPQTKVESELTRGRRSLAGPSSRTRKAR